MNILFLTMADLYDINQRTIYTDLMRKFRDEGHSVYILTPRERRLDKPTELVDKDGVKLLMVKTLNVQSANVLEKGIGQVSIGYIFMHAINTYFKDVTFDLILYSTPPITFTNVIKSLKKRNPRAVTYLLLKDIFPQNAVDLGMLTKSGLKGLLYKHFRKQEKQLYNISDYIGCMSPANVNYLLEHNPYIDQRKVELAPNSTLLPDSDDIYSEEERTGILSKYGIPTKVPLFIYGGNLGKPQDVPFIIKCLDANKNRTDCHFLIIGSGTDFHYLNDWCQSARPSSVTVLSYLPKEDYVQLVRMSQIGMIFLDYNFTIPNYPSRLLNYLESKKPIIACTDPNTDVGYIAEENGYGVWAPSNDVIAFTKAIDRLLASNIKDMGERGYEFFKNNYLVDQTYEIIMKHLKV